MRPALLILALVSSLACGGAASGSPGGSGGGGGEGTDPGTGAGGGTAGTDPASAPIGASVSLEHVDDGGDCAGLVPASAPAPLTIHRAVPAGSSCAGGTSDGTGAVAVGARDGAGVTSWQAYAADGSAHGAFAADPPLLPQPSGWQAVASAGPQGAWDPAVELVTLSPDGSAAHRERASPDPSQSVYVRWSLAPDPAGGSLVALRSSAVAGNHWSSVAASRFDASGSTAWPSAVNVRTVASATDPLFLAGGVSTRGEALVVSQHSGSLDVSWLDRGGAVIQGSAAERAEPYPDVVGDGIHPALELVPLLDGSLAVRSGGTFRRVYPRLATVSAALPPWLAERAASTLRFTRGNAGYAAMPPPGQASPDCTQRIELVSPSGRLCGRVVLREAATACTTGAADQGWDGTVVQQSGKDPCTYHVWPRLLAR